MKVIIAGSRSITNPDVVKNAIINSGFTITEVVSGAAKGVDRIGEWYGRSIQVPIKQFYPDWSANGRGAGFIRNREMAEYAEALIAVWDGKSNGTKNMINEAQRRGLRVYVHRV